MSGVGWLRSDGWKTIVKGLVFVALLFAANQLTHYLTGLLQFEVSPANENAVHQIVMISALLYSALLAIPFVPGAEIGLALLVTLGPPIVLLVYLCTIAGLAISYLVGMVVPVSKLRRFTKLVGLTRTSNLLGELEPLNQKERLSFLTSNTPNRMVPLLLRYRYFGLGILFNLPGNFLIGGGGGIGLIAGMSGLFSFFGYFLTVLIAVSPVPLAVAFFGTGFLD